MHGDKHDYCFPVSNPAFHGHGFNSHVYVAIVQLQSSTSLMGSYIILFSTDQLAT